MNYLSSTVSGMIHSSVTALKHTWGQSLILDLSFKQQQQKPPTSSASPKP